jgi:lysozyme
MKTITTFLFILISFKLFAPLIGERKDCPKSKVQKKEVYVGIDISKYQPNIDWSKLDSVDFIICKKSEGVSLEDAKYKHHIQNIPCLKGVYHFFRPQYSGIEQAKFFLKNLDTVCIDLKPVIDVEWSKWWTSKNRKLGISRLCDMIGYIEKEMGCKPIIYTSPKFWNTFIGKDLETKGIHLWVADWRGDTIPEVPSGFEDWHIWQQSSNVKIDAISGPVDWNIAKSIDSLLMKP